jgi:tetratricopeptide (TPR) repeat protein
MQSSMGVASYLLGEYARAISLLQGAIPRLERFGLQERTRAALSKLAGAHMMLGQQAQAVRVYARLRDMARRAKDRTAEAVALNGMAQAETALNRPHKALPLLEEGLRLAQWLDDPGLIGQACNGLMHTYSKLGDHDQAIAYGRRARNEGKRHGDELMVALGRHSLGVELASVGRKGLARRELKAALEYLESHGHMQEAQLAREELEKLA